MPKNKKLPPAKIVPEVIDSYMEGPAIVIVLSEYTPEMGRQSTSQGGWGKFSGVGAKGTSIRRGAGSAPV